MKATAEETDGAFMLLEDQMTRGKTTPLHTHPNADETIIVLEGEILIYAEGREHRVGPRGVAVALRGAPHAFMVTSESALILTLQTPGSGEAFYRDASEPATAETDPGSGRAPSRPHADHRSAPVRGGEGALRRESQSLERVVGLTAFHPPGWLLTTYPRARRRWPLARPELVEDGLWELVKTLLSAPAHPMGTRPSLTFGLPHPRLRP